jgi:hypothetical protein
VEEPIVKLPVQVYSILVVEAEVLEPIITVLLILLIVFRLEMVEMVGEVPEVKPHLDPVLLRQIVVEAVVVEDTLE